MSKLIIVVGLMGCGKTTFAKEYAKKFNYEFIDFDLEWHTKIQDFKDGFSNRNVRLTIDTDKEKFLSKIANLLNNNSSKNYIIDGWFKWLFDWWMEEEDNSLQELKKLLKFHDIEIMHLSIPIKKSYKRYVEKHKKEERPTIADYENTMKKRYKNLDRKIFKWVIQ